MSEKLNEQVTKELLLCSRFLSHRHGHHRGQEQILKLMKDRETLSQKELQEELSVRPGSISEIITKMEHRGLIERTRSEDDSRAVILKLTEEGKDAAANMMEPEDIYSSLNEEELQSLKEILTKLNNDWIRREPIHRGERHCHEGGRCGGPHRHEECGNGPRPCGGRGPDMCGRHGQGMHGGHGPGMGGPRRYHREF